MRLLEKVWCPNEHANAMGAVFRLDEVCYKYKVFDGQIARQDVLDLNWHNVDSEGDNCIVLHIKHAVNLVFNLVLLSNVSILTFSLYCFPIQIIREELVVLRRRFCCC